MQFVRSLSLVSAAYGRLVPGNVHLAALKLPGRFFSVNEATKRSRTVILDVNDPKSSLKKNKKKGEENDKLIKLYKKDIKQSPLRMKFLVRLVRRTTVLDALAQMKFSPKHRTDVIEQLLQRGVRIAKARHDAIPEELYVHEVMVTKGPQQKKMRIMGKGRTGFGYKRTSHVRLTVEVIDFERMIKKARGFGERKRWQQQRDVVAKLKGTHVEEAEIVSKI